MSTVLTEEQKPQQKRGGKYGTPENLKPYVKGISGNPAGRRKGTGITDALLRIMTQVDKNTGLTGAEAIAQATFKLAKKGHPIALREVWDRVEGKVRIEIDVQTESQLWQRLNQGRMRLAATVTTESRQTLVTEDGTLTTELSETRSIEYDAPAEEPNSAVEAVLIDTGEDPDIPWL